MTTKRLRIVGVILLVLGVLSYGIIAPALTPGAGPSEYQWLDVVEKVSIISALFGVIVGVGIGFLIVSVLKQKDRQT